MGLSLLETWVLIATGLSWIALVSVLAFCRLYVYLVKREGGGEENYERRRFVGEDMSTFYSQPTEITTAPPSSCVGGPFSCVGGASRIDRASPSTTTALLHPDSAKFLTPPP